MAIISNLLRLIAKPIFLKLGKGLKSSKTQYCLGDELDIRLDESITGKDNVIAKPPTRINSLARWVDDDSKQITDSKTIQDDDGTTYTRTDQASYLMHQIENTNDNPNYSAVYECMVHERGGNAQFIWGKRKTQNWTAYLNRDNNSFNISGNDLKNTNNRGDLLTMLPNGVIFGYHQPKASARLTRRTPAFAANTWFQPGANLPFVKIRDEDGFNKSSSNFFLGDGKGKGAFYTFPYTGVWSIHFQFLIDMGVKAPNFTLEYRFTWGKPGSYLSLRRQYSVVQQVQSMALSTLLPLQKGDIGFVEIRAVNTTTKPFIYGEGSLRSIDNYMGFYLLSG